MVAAISDLLKVVKVVGDDATRSTRALDSAVEAISSAMKQMDSSEPAQGSAVPDEVTKAAKAVAACAAQLVIASNGTQEQIIEASGQARTIVDDLLRLAKGTLACGDECAMPSDRLVLPLTDRRFVQSSYSSLLQRSWRTRRRTSSLSCWAWPERWRRA